MYENENISPTTLSAEMHADKDTIPHSQSAENSDAQNLAELGYRQELKREFNIVEMFGLAFSMVCVVPGISLVFSYHLPTFRF